MFPVGFSYWARLRTSIRLLQLEGLEVILSVSFLEIMLETDGLTYKNNCISIRGQRGLYQN